MCCSSPSFGHFSVAPQPAPEVSPHLFDANLSAPCGVFFGRGMFFPQPFELLRTVREATPLVFCSLGFETQAAWLRTNKSVLPVPGRL